MLLARAERAGTPSEDEQLRRHYEAHLAKVDRFLASRRCFSVLRVDYRSAVERPREEAQRISAFLGVRLDVEQMAAVGDPALYRNRQG
jgi:hypothetical protein